jgi:hypothetical protein
MASRTLGVKHHDLVIGGGSNSKSLGCHSSKNQLKDLIVGFNKKNIKKYKISLIQKRVF